MMKAKNMSPEWVGSRWYSAMNLVERDLFWWVVSHCDLAGCWEPNNAVLVGVFAVHDEDKLFDGAFANAVVRVGKWWYCDAVVRAAVGGKLNLKAAAHVKIHNTLLSRGFAFDSDGMPVPMQEFDLSVNRPEPVEMPGTKKVDPKRNRPAQLEHVQNYAKSKGLSPERAEPFWDYQEARGWNGIQDWFAAFRAWCRRGDEMDKKRGGLKPGETMVDVANRIIERNRKAAHG